MTAKVYIASDHAGYGLKTHVLEYLTSTFKGRFEVTDLGCDSEDSVDYPDYAAKVAKKVSRDPVAFGVLVCGSGQGMAMAANKFKKVRAALCFDPELARLARTHNDANILCLAGRVTAPADADKIAEMFFNTAFSGESRHARRVEKLDDLC